MPRDRHPRKVQPIPTTANEKQINNKNGKCILGKR